MVNNGVVVVRDGQPPDAELLHALETCGAVVRPVTTVEAALAALGEPVPHTVIVELDDDGNLLAKLAPRLSSASQLIIIGDPRLIPPQVGVTPDCVFQYVDEETLRGVLRPRAPTEPALARELVGLSVFGGDLDTTLHVLAKRLADVFGADDCLLLLLEEAAMYAARTLSDEAVGLLAPLCETVCQFGTTVIAPPRPDRPYRTFLGLPLSREGGPPIALLLLCRAQPSPFPRDLMPYLRPLVDRLSVDLSWRLVHERLVADRDRLRVLSRIDPVLGVANRAALQDELARGIAAAERKSEPFCVSVIDVDGLRLINERNGYPAGDAVLSHVAQVARLETGPRDIVARYAGDSVAIGLPGAAPEEATQTLTRILSAIDATPVFHEDTPINLTVSAGIAELHYDDTDTPEAALARAMAARDKARLHGEVIALADRTLTAQIAEQADFEIGRTLGGVYQIRHEISRGSFGVVYRAEDLALGRQVALKLLRPDLARDTGFVEGFRKEAATLARIRNPNLVQVYSFGVDGSSVFFAMELVEGQGLDARVISARRRRRHFQLPEVIRIVDEVANALEAVHRAGMLHRDVKPENILIDRINRRCVLVDVGIAVRRGEKHPAGTPGFTAPEVFGEGGETPSTDVYSLGALAYLLLTLATPFGDAEPVEMLQLQQSRPARTLTSLRADLPPEVDAIVLPTLDPDPSRRPQSARELARALSDALARPDVQPRMTVERPAQHAALASSRAVSLRTTPSQPPQAASTRGVLFRSVYEVLGARRGAAWLVEVCHKNPELANVLAPQNSPLAWHPTSAFLSILETLGDDPDDRRVLAYQLGEAAIAASFRQFYGADPAASTPIDVLAVADMYMRSYHSWGTPEVTREASAVELAFADNPEDATLCASLAGLIAGMGSIGENAARVEHVACKCDGAPRCVFRASWSDDDSGIDDAATVIER